MNYKTCGDFSYVIKDGKVTIIRYIGKDKKVVIPANIEDNQTIRLDNYCFSQTGVEDIVIPDGVESLGISCFCRCPFLKTIKLPKALKRIESHCFDRSGIEYIEIPDGVEDIQARCFWDCRALKRVKLPQNIKQLGHSIFAFCSNLREIKGGDSLDKTALYDAFLVYGCNIEVTFPQI